MPNPKISVIIPVYNASKYLSAGLDFVINQTFKDIEIICVDDGSQDNSAELLLEYAARDPRIKIIRQKNQGAGAARNKGIEAALGEFVYFVDADDFIHSQLLEICHFFVISQNADCVMFKHDRDFHNKGFIDKEKKYTDFSKIPYQVTDNPLFLHKKHSKYKMTFYVWARLWRKTILQGVEFIPGIYYEDDPFCCAIYQKRPKTILLNEPLYYYVLNRESISNTSFTPKRVQSHLEGIKYIWQKYKDEDETVKKFLTREVIYKKLRNQWRDIKRSPKQNQPELLRYFREELIYLDGKGLLEFGLNPRKILFKLKYKKLIKSKVL